MPTDPSIEWPTHMRWTFGGPLGTEDIWTCGLRFCPADFSQQSRAQLVALLPQLAAPLTTWFQGSTAMISGYAQITWMKLSEINAQGHQVDPATVEYNMPTPVGGSYSSANVTPSPTQTWALTLRTDVPRGRGHSGRIYPPWVGASVTTEGRCTAAAATGMAQGLATMINSVCNVLTSNTQSVYSAVVVSPGYTSRATAPLRTIITHVECDQRPDHILNRISAVKRLAPPSIAISGP